MLRNQEGMTLIEIMIVIMIMAGIMAVMIPNVMDSFTKSKVKQSEVQLSNLKTALQNYMLDCGKYPSSEAGFSALLSDSGECPQWGPKPYADKKQLLDRFGHKFEYENDGQKIILTFLGRDGRPGGKGWDQDIMMEEDAN